MYITACKGEVEWLSIQIFPICTKSQKIEKLHDSQKEMLLCTKFPYSKEEKFEGIPNTILVT